MSVAIVTGASSGLGRELARIVAQSHSKVVLTGRNVDQLNQTATELRKENPRVEAIIAQADLADRNDLGRLLQQLDQHGPIQTVVLNAGGGPFGKFAETDPETLIECLNLNITANVRIVRHLLPTMLQHARSSGKTAKIYFISSHASFMRVPHFAVYGAAKSFLTRLAQTLRLELVGEPIDIRIAFPGAMATQFGARAGIPRMISEPANPAGIAKKILGSQSRDIVPAFMDVAISIVDKVLPSSALDFVVRRTQQRFLKENSTK